MLLSVEVEISADGQITLCEPLELHGKHRAILTVLEPLETTSKTDSSVSTAGNGHALLKALRDNPLPPESRRSADEIEAQIRAEREAWD
ncbi:MAG: hypothetical protein HQL54_12895 [Magnetococcales bacterium]|nr:hypothetical protein [Magnetococcales bacterium]